MKILLQKQNRIKMKIEQNTSSSHNRACIKLKFIKTEYAADMLISSSKLLKNKGNFCRIVVHKDLEPQKYVMFSLAILFCCRFNFYGVFF